MIDANVRTPGEYITVIRAREALARSPIAAMREIIVESNSTGIVLNGQVSLFYYKQLAQELVRKEIEDAPLFNRIEVAHLD